MTSYVLFFCQNEVVRADRLLSLIWLLKSGRPLTATALAAQLEVSPRTILRDVEALSAAGVPVYCERGRTGGVRLLPGFSTDVTALTEGEAQALLSAVAAAPAAALGLADDLASALRKVTAALPETVRSGASLADRILIDPGGWHGIPAPPRFATLQRAVLEGRRLVLRYQRRFAARPIRRTVDPAGLVNAAGVWYLAAFHRGRLHFYHAQRVAQAVLLGEDAHVPVAFDLAAAWSESRARWHQGHDPISARLRVRAGAMHRLHPSVLPPSWTIPADPDAWNDFDVTFGDLSHAVAVCTAMGSSLIVISPSALRETIQQQAKQVMALYS
jgi:predicted DNA-binding transcriptional regulator YafY